MAKIEQVGGMLYIGDSPALENTLNSHIYSLKLFLNFHLGNFQLLFFLF